MARVVTIWDNVDKKPVKKYTVDARELIKQDRFETYQPAAQSEPTPVEVTEEAPGAAAVEVASREEAPAAADVFAETVPSAPVPTAEEATRGGDLGNAPAAPADDNDPLV